MDFDRISPSQGQHHVYLDFYHLNEPPFSITPDPDFLFYSRTHKNVIEKILYGINNRMGFILLTGEVGTGKTTICRGVLDRLEEKAHMVYIINPSLSGMELISTILDDLGISCPVNDSKKELIDQLNRFLLDKDRDKPVIIIVDDAQTMPLDALEDLRLLSNLETDKEKLLQLVLVGQPELLDLIGHVKMRQLRQRVSVTCHLDPLRKEDIAGYIARRLFVAGDNGQICFTPGAVKEIAKSSHGAPRLINRICDYTLMAAYMEDEFVIQRKHVKKALPELGGLKENRGWGGCSDLSRKNVFNRKWPHPFYRNGWMSALGRYL